MAERIVSPGVFTRERDLSFLTQGISEIGGAFIGPTPKGPAFIPTIVRSQLDYVTQFGEADQKHYTGLTVKNYLREAGVATVVRVLGLTGYNNTTTVPGVLYASGTLGVKVLGVLHPSSTGNTLTNISSNEGPSGSFTLVVSASGGANVSSSFSALESSTSYVVDYFGTSPETTKNSYMYSWFPESLVNAGNDVKITAATSSAALFFSGSTYGMYKNASTPWINSQTVGGQRVNLFKIHTLGDGNAANKELKVSFINIKPSGDSEYDFGTFTLLVREYDDTEAKPVVLEQYDNINLDPDSPNYVARAIGNSAPTTDPVTNEIYYQGDFLNQSKYIRVEMTDASIPATALPFGFDPYYSPVSGPASQMSAPNMVSTRWLSGSTAGYTIDAIDKKYYYGFDFSTPFGTNSSYLAPLPSGSNPVGPAFNLENVVDVPNGLTAKAINIADSDSYNYRKFNVAFQGGFDGMNPARDINMGGDIVATNTQGFNLQNSTSAGSVSYKKALDALGNPEQWDFNLLTLPGVIYEYHPYVAISALNLCEERGDCFYIMDTVGLNATLATATNTAAQIDSSYAGTYYPWLRVIDTNTNKLLWVPPSIILPEVYAYSDNVAAEWWAVAGLNRGGIASATGVKVRVPQSSRDILYEGRVNPIAQFPGQGICVWGQKTLQRRASALDRINVRRLLIAVKKFIASASRYLVFEQNVEATRNRFLNIANPYLASVQERSGLYAFHVVMDETNNTADVIDRNILYGQIYLQPTKTSEMIILDFNVLPTGATFPTA